MRVIHGDCIEAMAAMEPESIDAIVCDPPYGLGFMGKKWDISVPGLEWAQACLRVLKPGGHLIAFGGTRTVHRLTCAIEDAGFEVRDQIHWCYWSGFPKSHDISKAIDKAAGAEREVVGKAQNYDAKCRHAATHTGEDTATYYGAPSGAFITAPATPNAIKWNGWGSALKPSIEPAVLARKPLSEPTLAANVLRWGTGGLNIDACRIAQGDVAWPGPQEKEDTRRSGNAFTKDGKLSIGGDVAEYQVNGGHSGGRWPANLYHCPKPSTRERERGCDGLEVASAGELTNRAEGSAGLTPRAGAGRSSSGRANQHPTVKPVPLMRWLVRLVTPPGGVVLDCFLGSGTTGVAAVLEGVEFVGIEREAKYVAIATERIRHAAPGQEVESPHKPVEKAQPSLF